MMIDVAVIAPIAHLDDLCGLGSIDMALTQLVLASSRYASYYATQAAARRTVILDNGAYELETSTGTGLTAEPVLQAAESIAAAEVVCTDVPFDGSATVAATRLFLSYAADVGGSVRFMGVPQGSTRREWLACYETLLGIPEIDVIGLSKLSVPRCWDADISAARVACTAELHVAGPPPRPLHLLGGDRSLPPNCDATATWAIMRFAAMTPRCRSGTPPPGLRWTREPAAPDRMRRTSPS
jgi:hypothetical protein